MNNRIRASTKLMGIIGSPIRHSKSPDMHNHSFEKLGLDYVYMAFDIEEGLVKEGVEAMRTLKAEGFNVTMPHKEKVMEFLDVISTDAKIIGSVNTVVNNNGKLIGYNTDGRGFIKSLEKEGVNFQDEKIVIIGAGGACRSIAIQLALHGAGEFIICNRTLKRGEDIVNTINKEIGNGKARAFEIDDNILKEELRNAKILINTTSIGMKDSIGKSPIRDNNIFHKDLFVADIIYEPSKTKFLSQAEKAGCKTMNGINMLLYQGALAFKLWTGKDMPVEYIKEILFNKR